MTPPRKLLVTVTFLLTTLAAAQTTVPSPGAATGDETVKLEAFTVTGSNIRRSDAETALPVTILNAADLDASARAAR